LWFFVLVILEIGFHSLLAQASPDHKSFIFKLPTRMAGVHHHTQWFYFFFFPVEMESCGLFCPGWLQTVILPISASQVARIIGMIHCSPHLYPPSIPPARFSYFEEQYEYPTHQEDFHNWR
jgi:hypothetical protein